MSPGQQKFPTTKFKKPTSSISFTQKVLDIVSTIPPGKVTTYGQIAALAGYPKRARQVGQALHNCPDTVPWHRVLGAGGQIRLVPPQEQLQRLLAEGVLTLNTRINLEKYQWRPGALTFI